LPLHLRRGVETKNAAGMAPTVRSTPSPRPDLSERMRLPSGM
jgi:hypothetical protein